MILSRTNFTKSLTANRIKKSLPHPKWIYGNIQTILNMEHKWVTEERDGGIDFYDVTFCSVCSVHAADNIFTRSKGNWLPGTGLEKLPDDCIVCGQIIEKFKFDTRDAIRNKIQKWHHSQIKQHHKITRPIYVYLGWHKDAYEEYVKTGIPPYHYPLSWYR